MAALRRGAVRSLLRQRRCDAACSCCSRALYLERTGDRRNDRRAVARDRGGARLDRRSWRSRRRRLRRIPARNRTGPRQPGLEGFARRDLSCRRQPGRRRLALAEVQGYVFAAKHAAARCARQLGRDERAAAARSSRPSDSPSVSRPRSGARSSTPMRWRSTARRSPAASAPRMPDRCCSAASRVPIAPQRSPTALLGPQFFSGWGIRTVARGEARYNPMSYHNGSIWPHDNALIALGFARYGLKRAVTQLFKGLFDAATYMELRRLPELFCGFQRQRGRGPTLYPVACSPQAWASATPFTLLEASLGLEFDPANSEIRLRNPRLPEFLDEVLLRNLQLGESSVDLQGSAHARRGLARDRRGRGGRFRFPSFFRPDLSHQDRSHLDPEAKDPSACRLALIRRCEHRGGLHASTCSWMTPQPSPHHRCCAAADFVPRRIAGRGGNATAAITGQRFASKPSRATLLAAADEAAPGAESAQHGPSRTGLRPRRARRPARSAASSAGRCAAPTDENMGRIVDVIVDQAGTARAAIIDFGGFLGVGSRKIAVDWNALRFRRGTTTATHHPRADARSGEGRAGIPGGQADRRAGRVG